MSTTRKPTAKVTTAKVTTLADLFHEVTESAKPARKARKASAPVTSVVPQEGRTISLPATSVTFTGKATRAEREVAGAFSNWAQVASASDEATATLVYHLVHQSTVSVRRASEIASEVLGSPRGWSKETIVALRWSEPMWSLIAVTPSLVADVRDEAGDPFTVVGLVARVATLGNRLGKAGVVDALAKVAEPSVPAYLASLEQALAERNAPVVVETEGETEETEGEGSGETDPVAKVTRLLTSALNTLTKATELGVDAEAHTGKVEEIVALALALQETLTVA